MTISFKRWAERDVHRGMNNAASIKVGDTVEFEAGCPVIVTEIETQESDSEFCDKHYGRSLVFSATFWAGEPEPNTFYVRRERSPISGPYVVR